MSNLKFIKIGTLVSEDLRKISKSQLKHDINQLQVGLGFFWNSFNKTNIQDDTKRNACIHS